MNGGQDLGGVHGLGPIDPEIDEPVFHAEWEKRAFALTLAMGFYGQWNIDQGRHARESMHPAKYMTSSYYQIWTEGLIKLMLDTGFVVPGEVHLGRQEVTPRDLHRDPVGADEVAAHSGKGRAGIARPRHKTEVQNRQQGARHTHEPGRPYKAATISAWLRRRNRRLAQGSRVSGHQRPRQGRKPATPLYGEICCPRIVGQRCPGQ